MRKLPQPRLLKEITAAQQTSALHLQAANATQAKVVTLLRELQAEHSGLSPEDRAARHREIDELNRQAHREQQAARRPMEELKVRYPRWIK
jgi:hypothetical protein